VSFAAVHCAPLHGCLFVFPEYRFDVPCLCRQPFLSNGGLVSDQEAGVTGSRDGWFLAILDNRSKAPLIHAIDFPGRLV
jgi:hypothetical protein